MSEQNIAGKTVQATAARLSVLIKLILFSLSLGLVPITSFFVSQQYIWNGNSTYAAITAVISANVVLIAYIITSVSEDKGETPDSVHKSTVETKKQQ